MAIVTVSSKGQLVIPRRLRLQMHLEAGAKVQVERHGAALVLRPVRGADAKWTRWRGRFSGRRLTVGLTEEHAAEIARDRTRRR